MDFFDFADQVAALAQLLKAQGRDAVDIYAAGRQVISIELEDDGTNNDNLDVQLRLGGA